MAGTEESHRWIDEEGVGRLRELVGAEIGEAYCSGLQVDLADPHRYHAWALSFPLGQGGFIAFSAALHGHAAGGGGPRLVVERREKPSGLEEQYDARERVLAAPYGLIDFRSPCDPLRCVRVLGCRERGVLEEDAGWVRYDRALIFERAGGGRFCLALDPAVWVGMLFLTTAPEVIRDLERGCRLRLALEADAVRGPDPPPASPSARPGTRCGRPRRIPPDWGGQNGGRQIPST